MKLARTLSAMTAIVGILIAQASPALAVSSGGLGGRPANPDTNNPRSSSIFIYEARAGQTKQDQLLVMNSTDEDATIDLYAVDGVTTQTGDLTCRQAVEPREDIGSWIKISEPVVTLKAGTDKLVDFTVDVPAGADVGEHNGCIVIQRQDSGAEANSGGVQLKTRQAIRVALIVPGEISRTAEIDAFNVTKSGGKQNYTVGIKNVGNVSADVDIKLRVKDMFGKTVYENGGSNVVTANQTRTLTYESELSPFFGGKYTVDLSISYDKRAGTFGVDDKAQLATKNAASQQMILWPSIIALISAAGVVIVVALAIIMHKKQSKKRRVSLKKPKK